MIRPI